MNLFSERKKLEEGYQQWLKEHPTVADTPFNVICYLESIGRLKDCKEYELFLADKEICMDKKIRNKQYFWLDQNGLFVRWWTEKEYDTLSPTDKKKYVATEVYCPKCRRHLYYEIFNLFTTPPTTCEHCGMFIHPYYGSTDQYREVELELYCLETYEYYDEEYDIWIPKRIYHTNDN